MSLNFRKAILALPAALLLTGTPTFAQEESVQSEEAVVVRMAVDDESGGEPIIVSSSSFSINGAPGERSIGFFGGADMMGAAGNWMPQAMDPMSLLDDEQVRADLELVGEQLDKYKAAQQAFRDQLGEKTKALASGKLDPAMMGNLAKEIAEMKKAGREEMQNVLMPHQLDRLKQVALQLQMQKQGAALAILNGKVAEELGIDEDQKQRIMDKEKELKEEMKERMEKLTEEMKEKLLGELSAEQRSKLKELSGDKIDYKPMSINDRIRKRLEGRMKGRIQKGS